MTTCKVRHHHTVHPHKSKAAVHVSQKSNYNHAKMTPTPLNNEMASTAATPVAPPMRLPALTEVPLAELLVAVEPDMPSRSLYAIIVPAIELCVAKGTRAVPWTEGVRVGTEYMGISGIVFRFFSLILVPVEEGSTVEKVVEKAVAPESSVEYDTATVSPKPSVVVTTSWP